MGEGKHQDTFRPNVNQGIIADESSGSILTRREWREAVAKATEPCKRVQSVAEQLLVKSMLWSGEMVATAMIHQSSPR